MAKDQVSKEVEVLGRRIIEQVVASWPQDQRPKFSPTTREAADMIVAHMKHRLAGHFVCDDYAGGW